jgi:hypothetical protein
MYTFNFGLILFYLRFYYTISNIKIKKNNIFRSNFIINKINENHNIDDVNSLNDLNNLMDIIDIIENEPDDNILLENKKKEYYETIKGYDERFCLKLHDDTVCKDNDNSIIVFNTIYGFFQKKKLFEKLINIIKLKKDNETLHHLLDSNTLNDIKQYNNDNKNVSIYTHNIISGELFHDW